MDLYLSTPLRECQTCGVFKDPDGFYSNKNGGSHRHCRECVKIRVKDWRSKNMDKAVKYNKKWRQKNPDKWHAIKLAKYGLSVEDYGRMLEEQGGGCAICGGRDEGRRLSVDHCHETGLVRGLLCIKCNSAIGYLHTGELLDSAKRYLSA